jgi:hypothetical protein
MQGGELHPLGICKIAKTNMLMRSQLCADITKPTREKSSFDWQWAWAVNDRRVICSHVQNAVHASWSTTAKVWVRWLECYSAFPFWKPFHLQWSTHFNWHWLFYVLRHVQLQFGKLTAARHRRSMPLCYARCSLSKMYIQNVLCSVTDYIT